MLFVIPLSVHSLSRLKVCVLRTAFLLSCFLIQAISSLFPMFPLKMPSHQLYDHVPSSDDLHGTEILNEKPLPARPRLPHEWTRYIRTVYFVATVVLVLLVGFGLGFATGTHHTQSSASAPTPSPASGSSAVSSSAPASFPSTASASASASGACSDPYFRKEWRSLSEDEKKDYLDAFQCLIDSPSAIGLNGSLYNDMSWVHNLVAHSSEYHRADPDSHH